MRRRRGSHGQALTETALILPVLLLLTVGAIDAARVVWAVTDLAHAAREGARLAIVRGGSPHNPCPVGPPAPQAVVPPASAGCPYPSPSKQAIVDRTVHHIVGPLSQPTVTVCYGKGCTGNGDAGNNAPGTEVSVIVSGRVETVIAKLLGIGQFELSSKATMTISR